LFTDFGIDYDERYIFKIKICDSKRIYFATKAQKHQISPKARTYAKCFWCPEISGLVTWRIGGILLFFVEYLNRKYDIYFFSLLISHPSSK